MLGIDEEKTWEVARENPKQDYDVVRRTDWV
jgi:hypothetical protein